MARLDRGDRKATVIQITRYHCGMQKSISDGTTRRTLKHFEVNIGVIWQ